MSDHRLPYADAETPREMTGDCHEVEHNLGLQRLVEDSYPGDALGDAPVPAAERLHSRYEVSDDLARMADGLELHFD